MRLAGMASATVSKFAIAMPPRFLISSTTSSAGAALVPEPSAATPGSLTTTFAPSAAHSSAISRPMPRPAPVTMMTLSCSDLAIGVLLLFFVMYGRPPLGKGFLVFRQTDRGAVMYTASECGLLTAGPDGDRGSNSNHSGVL